MTKTIHRTEITCNNCTGYLFWLDGHGPVDFLACFSCKLGYTYEDGEKKRIE